MSVVSDCETRVAWRDRYTCFYGDRKLLFTFQAIFTFQAVIVNAKNIGWCQNSTENQDCVPPMR